jgi:2,3-bisphosphoglycerate-dependent phosphoglycerate mutase
MSSMLTRQPFWFLRHGQTDWNRTGRCQGLRDVPLSMKGEAEAHAAVSHLKSLGINAICSSPLQRARATADIIGRTLGLPVVDVPGLEEMDVGPYERVADYSWVSAWREDKPVAGIEPFPEVRRRVAEAANRALGTASHVLIVAHAACSGLCSTCADRPSRLLPIAGPPIWRRSARPRGGSRC